MNIKPKIMAVASLGGHWIQLLRITRGLEADFDIIYASTHPRCQAMVPGHRCLCIQDFSRWDAWKLPIAFLRLIKLVRAERPDVLLTTGAAPGLTALMAAKCCGVKTVWVDSFANAAQLSMCGKIAVRIADKVYTQWEDLADNRNVYFQGNILG